MLGDGSAEVPHLSLIAIANSLSWLAALPPAGPGLALAPSFQAAALAILPLALGSAVSPLVLVAQILTVMRSGFGLGLLSLAINFNSLVFPPTIT